jgi:hypothetical protein
MTTLQANDYNWTVNAKTASYTLVATDAGTRITMTSASATTITVNTSLFTAGDTLEIINLGAGVCTITAGTATVSTAGSLALSQYEGGQLYFNSTGAAVFFDIVQSSGMTNPMTTTGDTIYSSSGTTPARLGIGTTGQVLTVAAGLPSWSTPASSSPLTTKGDLYTYSTTNTALAIGADYGFLQALASASTGNQWNSGAWTSYTPTVTPEAGAITSYTIQRSAYVRVGKLCVVNLNITITNKGTGSGALFVSAPFNSYNDAGSGVGREIAVVGTMLYSSMGSNNFQIRKYDATTVLVNNYVCALTITYEVA